MKYPDQNLKDFLKSCIKVYFRPVVNFFVKSNNKK